MGMQACIHGVLIGWEEVSQDRKLSAELILEERIRDHEIEFENKSALDRSFTKTRVNGTEVSVILKQNPNSRIIKYNPLKNTSIF